MKLAIWCARIVVAAVFLYAGIAKLHTTNERFAISIAQFFIFPQSWIAPLAIGLPSLEILVGVLLVIPRTARYGAVGAGILLVIFLGVLSWAWSQAFTVDCGCFGATEDEPVPGNQIPHAIARDLALLALTLLLAVRRPHPPERNRPRNAQKTPGSGEDR